MGRIQFTHTYDNIISLENLLEAWREFSRGKTKKKDMQEFSLKLMDNIIALHHDLKNQTYQHGGYHAFNISDPKPRNIHKATVRDRLVHHAIYRVLYPFFDRAFIADSYSCRVEKGTHRAMKRFQYFARKVSKNNTRTCWVLKCDVRKFLASIDHETLKSILREYISDAKILWLLDEVVGSFLTPQGTGLPLGNLTSQLLVNIYMNEFDQYVKHKLKVEYYVRYADDFALLSHDRKWLELQVFYICKFLHERLKLKLHPDKLFLKTLASGVDFLGWVHFADHRVLRMVTRRRRMMKKIDSGASHETAASHLGMLKHGNTRKLQKRLKICMGVDFLNSCCNIESWHFRHPQNHQAAVQAQICSRSSLSS